jgi:hypothetical protein
MEVLLLAHVDPKGAYKGSKSYRPLHRPRGWRLPMSAESGVLTHGSQLPASHAHTPLDARCSGKLVTRVHMARSRRLLTWQPNSLDFEMSLRVDGLKGCMWPWTWHNVWLVDLRALVICEVLNGNVMLYEATELTIETEGSIYREHLSRNIC